MSMRLCAVVSYMYFLLQSQLQFTLEDSPLALSKQLWTISSSMTSTPRSLVLGRWEPDPDQPAPAHDTRAASKEKEQPEVDKVKVAMGYSKDVRGRMPKPFSARTELLRGPAKDFSLGQHS